MKTYTMGKTSARKLRGARQYFVTPIGIESLLPAQTNGERFPTELFIISQVNQRVLKFLSEELRRAIIREDGTATRFYEKVRGLALTEIQKKKLGKEHRSFQELIREATVALRKE